MQKLSRKILVVALVALLSIAAVALFRAQRFRATGPPPAKVAPLDMPDRARAERLAGLLAFPTISYENPQDTDWSVFEAMHAYLEDNFPETFLRLELERVNRYGLLFRWPGREPSLDPLVLLAHQDVVPVLAGTEDDWPHPPFGGVIAGGFIWGRGAMDDKGSLAAILEATEWLLSEGFTPRRTIYLAFGQDEEVGGSSGAQAIAALFRERGMRPAMILDEGGLIAEGLLPGVEVPVALVGVAEKGFLTVSLEARGRGGHSSIPPRHTSVGRLARAISRLEASPFPADTRFAVDLFRHLGNEISFDKRLVFANRWLTEPLLVSALGGAPPTDALIRTTTAATVFRGGEKENVLPIEAEAVVNFRLLPGETVDSALARVVAVIDDPEVSVQIRDEAVDPSPVSPAEGPAWEAIRTAVTAASGERPIVVAPFLVVGGTDARHYSGLSEHIYRFLFLRMGEGDPDRIHGSAERISVSNYDEMVRFYVHLMREGM